MLLFKKIKIVRMVIKFLCFFICAICICSCQYNSSGNNLSHELTVESKICEDYSDTLLKYAKGFKAVSIELDSSLSAPLNNLISSFDTVCFRKQEKYKTFISIIFLKLYDYHLHCCNQGYDLLAMETGNSKILIRELKRIAGYQNQNLEMLNSGIVVNYVESDKSLEGETEIKNLLGKIHNEIRRINEGNI